MPGRKSAACGRWISMAAALLFAAAFFYYALALHFWPQVLYVTERQFVVSVPFTLRLPIEALWALPLLLAALGTALSRTGRAAIAAIRQTRLHLMIAILAVFGFLLTLYPQKFDGKVTISYLALASTGFMLLLYALQPLMLGTVPFFRFGKQGLSHLFLERVSDFLLHRIRPAAFLLLLSGFTFLLTNLISAIAFQHIPHVMDSVGQVFQARVFASGRAWLPAKWDDWFFSFVSIFNDGHRIYEISPPGHSLLLMLGSLVHAEWLVNPVLGALTIVVFYLLGRELYDQKTGRITALLGVLSPFLMFMSSEYMNHASALLCMSLFLLFFFRTVRDQRQSAPVPGSWQVLNPLLAGCFLGYAMSIRPLSALALSIPVAFYGAHLVFRARGRTIGRFLVMLVPVAFGFAAFFLHNYLTTGDPMMPGYKAYGILEFHHTRWGLGFGQRGWDWWGTHTPLRSLVQTGNNLNSLNESLFAGAIPGLVFVLLLLVSFSRNPTDYVLLACCISLPVAYFFYWFQDLCFGPRFLYESLSPLLLLSARGILEFPQFLARIRGPEMQVRARNVMRWVLLLATLSTLGIGLPHLLRIYSRDYWGVNDKVHARVKRDRIDNAVVFIKPLFPYSGKVWDSYYGAGFLYNSLDFAGPVVYARDRGVQNYALMLHFPGRRYYCAGPDYFYEMRNPDSLRNSAEIRALTQAGVFVRNLDAGDYRFMFLPFREADALVPSAGLPVRTYREVSNELFLNRMELGQQLPALAVFLTEDLRHYLGMFDYMRGAEFRLYGFEILEPDEFAHRIRAADDPASRYILSRLSSSTRLKLEGWRGPVTTELKALLVKDINDLLLEGPLYDAERFADIALTSEIRNLLAQHPEGRLLYLLNRLLLEAAYPEQLAPMRPAPVNFLAGSYRFTRLFLSENEICAVYDIRPVTGDEKLITPEAEPEP